MFIVGLRNKKLLLDYEPNTYYRIMKNCFIYRIPLTPTKYQYIILNRAVDKVRHPLSGLKFIMAMKSFS